MISESTNRAGMTFVNGEPLLIPHLRMAWEHPAVVEAEKRAGQARIDGLFAQHDARVRADWERIWAENAREQKA